MEEIRSELATGGNHWCGGGGGGGEVPMDQSGGAVEQSALLNSGNTIDPDDWSLQLPIDDRRNIVNKLMGTLKKRLPCTEFSRTGEIAVGFEKMVYSTSTSQSEYQERLSEAMQTIETKSQSPTANSLQTNAVNTSRNSSDQASSLESTAQTGNAGARDWQEEVYQKIKSLKDTYLLEMNEMYMKIATKLHQLPQQPKNEQFDQLKIFKAMLEPLIQFVQLSKNDIHKTDKRKSDSFEKQIINLLLTYRSLENQMNPLMQQMNMQTSAATMAANSLQPNNTLSGQQPVNSSLRTKQLLKRQEQLQVVQSRRMKRYMHQKQLQLQMSRFVNQTRMQHRLSNSQRQHRMSAPFLPESPHFLAMGTRREISEDSPLLAEFINLDIGVHGNSSTRRSNTVEQDTDQLIPGLQKLMHSEEIDPKPKETVACEEGSFGGQAAAAAAEADEDMNCI